MWVRLNEEGMKVWGDVFPDGRILVCSMSFHKAHLQGQSQEEVILINWNALSAKQKNTILGKMAKLSGHEGPDGELQIYNDIVKVGLPLRKKYTTGIVAAELRFFI
jgi:hypothetical protein